MSSLITPKRRTTFLLGDPQSSEALRKRFLPYVGRDYIKTVCVREGLPYKPIALWASGDSVLADDLQRTVELLLIKDNK